MGIDAHFYVRTDRDLGHVFNDMWWKTRGPDEEIYVRKVPLGYEWYNLDRYYGPTYRRGYMPRLFVMFQVMNQNLEEGEAIYYCGDNYAYDDFLRHDINEPTSLDEMFNLLLDWCAFMGIGHLEPDVRWDAKHLPDGYGAWNREPQVIWDV